MTDPREDWYERLDKPSWQPPDAAFGAVWTVLYTAQAVASRSRTPRRRSG